MERNVSGASGNTYAGIYPAFIAKCHDDQQSGSIDQLLLLLHEAGTNYLLTHFLKIWPWRSQVTDLRSPGYPLQCLALPF